MAKRRPLPETGAAAPPRVALIDANVFFAPRMRDLVMHLHGAEVINVALLMSHGCTNAAEGLGATWGVECPRVAKDGTLYYELDEPPKPIARKSKR